MKMSAFLIAGSLAVILAATGPAVAGPAVGPGTLARDAASALVQEARLFCYNTATGRFLHWGNCGGGYPRVYCRSNYTGRFLHWGRC